MKSEKLLRAIGEIDDRFIEEADVQAAVNTRARKRRRNFAAIAASIAVIVIAGVLAVNGDLKMTGRANDTMPYPETASNTLDTVPVPTDRNNYAVNVSETEKNGLPPAASPADVSTDNSLSGDTNAGEHPPAPENDKSFEHLVPEDFSFSLVWGCYGISSYDSRTGELVKTSDTDHTEDYTTTYHMSEKEIEEIFILVEEMKPETYPDNYDPIKVSSEPSRTIILSITCSGKTKTIECRDIGLGLKAADEQGARFMAVHDRIVQILTSSDEWKALPEYEHFYE